MIYNDTHKLEFSGNAFKIQTYMIAITMQLTVLYLNGFKLVYFQ